MIISTTNKSQVSLEYLSTYSWAIIILLTIVSALSYFGFFNEKSLVQARCENGEFLSCEDSLIKVTDAGTFISLKLRNNMKADIELTEDLEIIEYSVINCPNWRNSVIKRGELWTSSECEIVDANFESGDIETLSFVIKYKKNSLLSPEHFTNGQLKTMVMAS